LRPATPRGLQDFDFPVLNQFLSFVFFVFFVVQSLF